MDNGNEWDDKLARHPDLGERIIHVMKNIQSVEKIVVDVGELAETEVKDLYDFSEVHVEYLQILKMLGKQYCGV